MLWSKWFDRMFMLIQKITFPYYESIGRFIISIPRSHKLKDAWWKFLINRFKKIEDTVAWNKDILLQKMLTFLAFYFFLVCDNISIPLYILETNKFAYKCRYVNYYSLKLRLLWNCLFFVKGKNSIILKITTTKYIFINNSWVYTIFQKTIPF